MIFSVPDRHPKPGDQIVSACRLTGVSAVVEKLRQKF
jgi:hypothetical protein